MCICRCLIDGEEGGGGPGQLRDVTGKEGGPGERRAERKWTAGAPGGEEQHAHSHGRSTLLQQVEDDLNAKTPWPSSGNYTEALFLFSPSLFFLIFPHLENSNKVVLCHKILIC